ncbi:DUF1389 domain-containing protein [Chlamydia crocodili]|uniref:DUF1389 domain-containing protein n=1 Tax=Chlamydia crocodili TaxID=2766982 RepID=A0ABX8CEV8_9CHLA|nr:DUF1389 domain-containing protein [Chlamydia crocodili]QVE49156.1 DUF1389 domain-containing protein [Chlamydia crocodili]
MTVIGVPPIPSVVKQDGRICLFLDILYKNSLLISSICCLFLSTVFMTLIAFGVTQPAIIVCLTVSFILSGMLSALILHRCATRDSRLPIPEGFRYVIRKHFPKVLYDLVIEKGITIQELRVVLSGLHSGYFTFPSTARDEKVKRFGLERLQKACEGIELPDLENLLLKHCPFYFMNKFIQLGPKNFPESENIPPAMYWFSHTGLSDRLDTICHPYIWILAQVISQDEYETLLLHAKKGTWFAVKDLEETVINKIRMHMRNIFLDKSWVETERLFTCIKLPWLLYVCKHGVSWGQLKLFKEICYDDVKFLNKINRLGGGMNLMKLAATVAPYINENRKGFDPYITLLTWNEWREDKKHASYDRIVDFLNSHSKNHLTKQLVFKIPCYSYDSITGDRKFKRWLKITS